MNVLCGLRNVMLAVECLCWSCCHNWSGFTRNAQVIILVISTYTYVYYSVFIYYWCCCVYRLPVNSKNAS